MGKASKQITKILNELKKQMSKKSVIQDAGDLAAELIKKRTRLGFGVAKQEGTKERLKPLSPGYKDFRKNNKPTGDKATVGKSNLTYTGEMLDSMAAKVSGRKAKIGPQGKNAKAKARWVSEDRPFNNLSKAEQRQIQQELDKKAREITKKLK